MYGPGGDVFHACFESSKIRRSYVEFQLSRSWYSLQVGIIRVFLLVWALGRYVLKLASMVARGLVACLLALPELVLPRRVCTIALNVSHVHTIGQPLLYSFEATVATVAYVMLHFLPVPEMSRGLGLLEPRLIGFIQYSHYFVLYFNILIPVDLYFPLLSTGGRIYLRTGAICHRNCNYRVPWRGRSNCRAATSGAWAGVDHALLLGHRCRVSYNS